MDIRVQSQRIHLLSTDTTGNGTDKLGNRLREVIDSIFKQPSAGELQHLQPEIWSLALALERQCGEPHATTLHRELQEALRKLEPFAGDPAHTSSADARILCVTINHCLAPGGQNLKNLLAEFVRAELKLGAEDAIPANPSSREFNSILPGLAAISYDCGSVGRTLIFEGASSWIGLPTDDEVVQEVPERCARLKNVMFGLPKVPLEGNVRLEAMWEFDMALDQLAANGQPTYEM